MEILIAIAGKVVDYTVRPVGRWLCYSFHYSSNIESMNKEVKKLRAARDRLQHSVDAITYGDEIHVDVKNWLEEANGIIEDFGKDFEGEEAGTKSCLNLKVRHQLSHKAAKIVTDIGEVLKKDTSFDTVSYRHAPQPQWIETLSRTEYMPCESRMSTVERLMEALRDDNIHVIGVWGMPGVGKSTLVREVAKQAMEEKLFDEVAIANVTQSLDVSRIQGEIAEMLYDLKLDKETERDRKILLQERLTKKEDKKMILVILDDIWKYLDLEDLGIPSKKCKVLLTSRDREVLVSEMGTKDVFGLDVLAEKEAWSLFERMAGNCVNKDRNMRSAATKVAKACSGLPLALVTVSKALKDKELFEWNNALLLLKRPAPEHLNKMQSTIYSSIELSYKHLKETNKEALDVFLHCAQMGYYIFKKDLLKYCCGLGLFHGINTMEDARNRLYTILRILEDCCLLLPYSFESLRMHDVVRDAATLIASRDYNMFVVRVDGGLREWPDADALKRCRAFSLRGGDVLELPNKMECPELRLLYLWGGGHQFQISDTLFEGTGKLKVLDLTKMQLSSLPSSLGLLRNLQTLCLDQCVLGDIAVIGELKNLAILSLLKSHISQLPREIGLLTRLRLLDLSGCSKLEVIPPNVLSKLIALEELYMGNSFVRWEAEGLNNERNNANLAELKYLSHLTTLEIHIPDVNNLPKDLLFEKLERYVIFVGDVWDWSDKSKFSRTLKLKMNTSFQSWVGFKMLLKGTENLYLDELKGVNSVLHELDRGEFQQLKHLHIQNNIEIKYIINSRMSVIAFPALETFLLKNMTGLEEICHGQLPLTSFGNLRVVKVEHCDKLKFVFSSSIARGLSQLEELEIEECSIMGAIVMKEEGEIEDTDLTLFPKLRLLALRHLPKLISFLSTQNSFITDAGEIISEGKLDFYMPILHEQVVFPNLERLELSSIDLEDVQHSQHRASSSSCRLENIQSTSRFQNLSHLEVQGSSNIKYLLSFSTARFMGQLKHLHISECKVMEEIIVTDESGVVEERIYKGVLFSQLECLFLKDLLLLKRFCIGNNIEFPSLKQLGIFRCPKLKTFIFKPVNLGMTVGKELVEMNAKDNPSTTLQPLFNEEVVFPSLERLELSSIDLEDVQHNQHRATSFSCKLENMQSTSWFQNLSRLEVGGSSNLKYLLSFSTARFMRQLKLLHIFECKVMEEIIVTEESGVVEERIIPKMVLFNRLEFLHLNDLPALKRFCIGSNIEFPSLQQLHIVRCPKLKTFIFKPVSSGMTVGKEPVEMNAKDNLCTAVQSFFIEEVAFPSLEKLRISFLDDLKIIWHNQFAEESFCKLQILDVQFCDNLTNYVFQSNMLARFQSLVALTICGCGSLEKVFELQGPNVEGTHATTVLQLENLLLVGLPKLKHVWNKDPQERFSFQNLTDVRAIECGSLESLFPASVARCLMRLEKLHIVACGVEEIVAEGAEAKARFVFPQVNDICLVGVPRLKYFYPGRHSSKWPMLKHLWVNGCQVDIFASELLSEALQESQLAISVKQSLFLVDEATFPNLATLRLEHCCTIWSGQVLGECFCKLKDLRLTGDHNNSAVPLSRILKGLHNLEILVVHCTHWEEVFPYEEALGPEEHARILPKLRELILTELPMLTHLWKEGTQPCQVLHNLEKLKVTECGKLKILVPSSVSFQNLSELEISKCHGLINLVTSPTAKTLVQLKKMSLSECESITEIVSREGGEANDQVIITFSKLTYLKLDCLPRLINFCSGSYYLEFPSLEKVIVRQCQEMKIFSCGDLSTPKLQRVQATEEDEWHWKDDLNSTIHWLWEGKL